MHELKKYRRKIKWREGNDELKIVDFEIEKNKKNPKTRILGSSHPKCSLPIT